jgi:hypothetical protein
MQRFALVLIAAAVLLAPCDIWPQPAPKLAEGLAVLPHVTITVLADKDLTHVHN